MAKKKRSKKAEPQAEQLAQQGENAPVSEVAPQEETLSLHDAARRFVPGFKEHWWPGIRKHATAMGFGDGGTVEACKGVLRHWGAKL